MPGYVANGVSVAEVISSADVIPGAVHLLGDPPVTDVTEAMDFFDISFVIADVIDEQAIYPNSLYLASSQTFDVLYRWYVVPSTLNLTNPRLNVDIPFQIWNTFSEPQTIATFDIIGTDSLQFDIDVGLDFRSAEWYTARVRILPGDPAIDARMEFTSALGFGSLNLIASLADTFNLIPEIPVREVWEYKTDIIKSYNGFEQRHSLRPRPRIKMSFNTLYGDEQKRIANYSLIFSNIQFESLVPFYQYATQPTQPSPIGTSRIYFQPNRSNFRVNSFLVAVDPETLDLFIGRVTAINADGVDVAATVTKEINSTWIVAPAFSCLVSNGSGFTTRSINGEINVESETFIDPEVLREGATRTVDTFDGLIHLNRRPSAGVQEAYEYERETIDNEIGRRVVKSAELHPLIAGPREFIVDRMNNPDDMDYFRSFINETKGSFKPFLLSTWLPDLTLAEPVSVGAGQLIVDQGYYAELFYPYETWRRLHIQYENGTSSFHTVTDIVQNEDGTSTLTIFPLLVNDPAFTLIKSISYLLKVMGGDTITILHEATTTKFSIQTITTDYGS